MTWTLTKRTWFYADPDFPGQNDSKKDWFNWFLTTFLSTKGWTTEAVPEGGDTWYGVKKTVTDAAGIEIDLAYVIEVEPSALDVVYGFWTDPNSPPGSSNYVQAVSESTNAIFNSTTRGIEVWETDEDSEAFMIACLNYGSTSAIPRYVMHMEWPSRMVFMGQKFANGVNKTYLPLWFVGENCSCFWDPFSNAKVIASYQYPIGPIGNFQGGLGTQPIYGDVWSTFSSSSARSDMRSYMYASLPDVKIRNPSSANAECLGDAEVVLSEGEYYIHTNYMNLEFSSGSGFLFNTGATDPTPPPEPPETSS